ncbi:MULTISPECIES: hypothetical protein [unclassified Methylobacterium]|jgi:hypothetical protein|uniref:hypothetical protein n=1 Tax=unclassified Methylobacterium TaxID=2615210 RepID=UPI0006FC7F71|nr:MULTISPECIES: hypothetical protein [unclassified Methylobacterium]KQP77518.1 hypothetical protein ASF57_19680 [Methylobacterium sp. Leaf117]KQP94067.1 hypothetical protein ASF60_13205 [Methylobacterium sp. Leaf113]MBY0256972.1 hypothetical protein [Methylobacterium sp.]MCJ2081529.1 hypothetical protein [Methylobacterium sp. J-090]
MVLGDQVVFARLDVADALGIWRHATGRIVDVLPARDGAQVVDVQFEGHGLLVGYIAALFQRVG